MDELVRWLGEQLDTDERIARAVRVPHEWHQGPGDDPEWTDSEMVCMWPPEFHTPYEQDKHWRGLTVSGEELAAFIAAHDPARVLREIDAKRQLLALHESTRNVGVDSDEDDPSTFVVCCGTCQVGVVQDGDWPCETLRLLALPYSDRPGYLAEWRL